MNKAISFFKTSLVCTLAAVLSVILGAASSYGFTTTNMSALTTTNVVHQTDLFPISSYIGGGSYSTRNVLFSTILSAAVNNTNRVNAYGGVGDGVVLDDVVSTSGSGIITSASASFTAADVGKTVCIWNGVYAGTKTATVSSGSPTITSLTTNGLLIGMFVGGYGIVTNTTITAFPSSSSATLSANADASLVGGILGFSPTYTVTTIASFQSANQVTLTANASFTGTGVRMIYGTNNRAASQAAIDALPTTGTVLGGVVEYGEGLYVIDGPLLNVTDQNSVLTFPIAANTVMNIVIKGKGPTGRGQNGNFSRPSTLTGTVLFCPSPGPGALFGGNKASAVTPLSFSFKDLNFRMPRNPTLSPINVYKADALTTDNVLCEIDEVNHATATLPVHPTIAIIGPSDQNGGIFALYNTDVYGFGAGVGSSFHCTLHNCQLAVNRKGVSMIGAGLGLLGCTFVGNQQDIVNDTSQNNFISAYWCRFEDHAAAGGENFVSTATFNEANAGGAPHLYGEVWGIGQRDPVNLSSSSGLNLHWINELTSPYLQHYNMGNISQKLYTDINFRARVAGDTTGMQFLDSSGNQLAYIDSNENFNQFFVSTAAGKSLIFKVGSNGLVIDNTGLGTFGVGVAGPGSGLTALNASALSSGTVPAAQLSTATTQTAGDNSTKIATTAYVDGGGGWVISQVTGSDATTTGQSLVDVTGLTFAAAANTTYEIEAVLQCTTTAVTTGTQYGINHTGTGSPSCQATIWGSLTTTTAATSIINALNTADATAFLTTSAQTGIVIVKGVVVSGTGAGNITIRHLKVTSGTSTVKIGSVMKVRKLI